MAAAQKDFPNLQDLENLKNNPGAIVSERFRRLFLAYAKAINKQQSLTGSLFQKYFRRKKVEHPDYFTRLIHYIHFNPVHHGFVPAITDWPWTSYDRMLSDKPTLLKKFDVLIWFGGKEEYNRFHQTAIDENRIKTVLIED